MEEKKGLDYICIWHFIPECRKKCKGYSTKCGSYLTDKQIKEREREYEDKQKMMGENGT